MATFNGISLGLVTECYDEPNEKRRQINAYPGVNGLEMLDMGTAGGTIVVESLITATDMPALLSAEQVYFGWQSATAFQAQLVNNQGATYASVYLNKYIQKSRIKPGPTADFGGSGGFARQVRFEFVYLV